MAQSSGEKWGLLSVVVIAVSGVPIWLGLRDSGGADVRTAREFVETYAGAWKRGNVEKIVRMQYLEDDSPVGAESSEVADRVAKNLKQEMAKAEIRRAFDSNSLFRNAWQKTKYIGEKQFDGYICVRVNAAGAVSDIVLKNDGEFLRIVPNPSDYDCLDDSELE